MQCADYLNHRGIFTTSIVLGTPIIFWQMAMRSVPELAAVMLRLYGVPVHTSALERCLSNPGGLETKHAANLAKVSLPMCPS